MRTATIPFLLAVLAGVSACDRGSDARPAVDILEPAYTARIDGDWGQAALLSGPNLNTPAVEGCPSESPDGRSLYFATNRSGNLDIYVTHRQPGGEWSEPEPLEGVNTSAAEFCPAALPGGRLMFVSDRNDGGQNCGAGTDIYETRLDPAGGWLPPEHLGCELNSAGSEFSPSYVPAGGGMLFFSSDRDSPGAHAIYVSVRSPGGSWQAPEPVDVLNAGGAAFRPNVSADGRYIVFDSNRAGSEAFDIWYAQRQTPHSEWSEPVRIQEPTINSAAGETRPWLSRDGRRLYFGSTRLGSSDLYVAERS